MRIFIPTLNRGPGMQLTVRELGPKIVDKYRVTLVCPPGEAKDFLKTGEPYHVMTCRAKGIAATRQFILDNSDDQFVLMLDDDLSSWSWREETPTGVSYRKATEQQRMHGMKEVEKLLKRHGHGSIGHRLFANARDGLDFNTRQLRALAYDRDLLKREGVKFRLPVMEDFDVQLQLLKRGHECFQYNWLVQEQRGSNEAGGCSTYRTDEVQAAAANRLAELHPECVSVVVKEQKGNGSMWGSRTDVKVNWRRAIRAGMEHKNAR
jgi:hypothetical protein